MVHGGRLNIKCGQSKIMYLQKDETVTVKCIKAGETWTTAEKKTPYKKHKMKDLSGTM